MSTVVMDTDKPVSRTDQLAEISQKLDLMAQSIGVLGAQVNYLMERAEADRRRQQTWDDLFEDLTPVANDMYHIAETQFEEMQQFAKLYKNPIVKIGFTYMEILPVGLLISLLCAALLKRNALPVG